jgi:PAS domain S-box-containing protein
MQDRDTSKDAASGATNALLRTLVDKLPDCVYVKDRESRFLLNNLAHAKILGANHPDEVIGKTDFDCFPKELAERYFGDDQALMQSGETLNRVEPTINKVTREIRWLQTTKIPLRDANGVVTGLVGISRDITEQKLLEQELAAAHGQLQAMLDNIPDRIFFKDLECRFAKCNRAVARRFGVGDTEMIIGKTDSDFYSADKARESYEDEQRVIRTGEPLINKIERVARSDDEVSWTTVSKVALRDTGGKIIGLVGISRDITEQKQAEEALRKSRDELERRVGERTAEVSQERRLLRTLIDNLPDAVYAKDTQGRKTLANAADLKNLGCRTEADALGKSDFDLFPREIAERFFADDQKVIQGQPVLNREEYYFDPTGNQHWLLTSKLPLRNQDDEIVGIVGIGRDITQQKQAEEALRRAHDELEQRVTDRTRELSDKNSELAKANEARAQAQRLLQALLDHIPDWIYFKDAQSRFLKCSRTHAQRLGIEAEQVVGKTDFDFFPADIAREFHEDEQRIIRTGESLINKVEKKSTSAGEAMWTSTTKVPMRDENGIIVGLVGVNRDITERIQAEEALRHAHDQLEQRVAERTGELTRSNAAMQQQIAERERAEQALAQERLLLRTLIDNLPDAVYAKDEACRKILVNPADLKNLGYQTEAEAIGKTDFDVFPRESAEKFHADDLRVIQGQPVLNREEYFLDKDNRQRWLLTSKLPLRNKDGRIVGLVGIGHDITEVKEAEKKLASLHGQLVAASRQAGMAEVATGVLHNVGNVLNSVNVSAELITEHLRNSRIVGVTKLAHLINERQADLARFLTEDERGRCVPTYLQELADFLQTERNELQDEVKKLVVNVEHIKEIVSAQQNYAGLSGVVEAIVLPELVEDALKIHSAAFARHGVTVLKEFEPLPSISTDKHKVLQIVVNLLHNAKYACDASTSPHKEVAVRLKATLANHVRIEIADNGVGIAPENLTRIFNHGFTTRKGGHGFGLHSGALSAKEMGGSLSVHSDGLGKGATFVLELPITAKADPHGAD